MRSVFAELTVSCAFQRSGIQTEMFSTCTSGSRITNYTSRNGTEEVKVVCCTRVTTFFVCRDNPAFFG